MKMKNLTQILLRALLLVTLLTSIVACQRGSEQAEGSQANESSGKLYQCAMHPNIVSDKPGLCPICGMELQAVSKVNAKGISGRAAVQLTEQQRQLINITTSAVKRMNVVIEMQASGIVEHDSSKVFTIAAWTSGRIEKLYIKEEEADIKKGDLLYSIYSPDLYAAMQDYLALTRGILDDPSLLESARVRLLQMGLNENQLIQLKKKDKAPIKIDIRSPVSGKVMMKMVKEGQYVKEGDALYTVVDLSKLWLVADIYEADLPYVKRGQHVAARAVAVPGKVFLGEIQLIEHHIDPKTRTAKARIVFEEFEGKRNHELLPDMWMRVSLERDLGEQLVIPRSAVFDTGKRQYVFIEKEKGLFVPREIELGSRQDQYVVVNKGLNEGEKVVTEGTFLLDSESLLKASASGSEADEESADVGSQEVVIAGFSTEAKTQGLLVWNAYLKVTDALLNDKLEKANTAYESMGAQLKRLEESSLLPATGKKDYATILASLKHAMPEARSDLKAARVSLGTLSEQMVKFGMQVPELSMNDLYTATCPMWHDSPSVWIQRGEKISNPFMGQSMPKCGRVQGKIKYEGSK